MAVMGNRLWSWSVTTLFPTICPPTRNPPLPKRLLHQTDTHSHQELPSSFCCWCHYLFCFKSTSSYWFTGKISINIFVVINSSNFFPHTPMIILIPYLHSFTFPCFPNSALWPHKHTDTLFKKISRLIRLCIITIFKICIYSSYLKKTSSRLSWHLSQWR